MVDFRRFFNGLSDTFLPSRAKIPGEILFMLGKENLEELFLSASNGTGRESIDGVYVLCHVGGDHQAI